MVGVDIDYRNVEERLAEAESLVEELRSRIEALTDSEEYRQGRELDRLRKRTDEARRSTESRRSRADARMAATPRLAGSGRRSRGPTHRTSGWLERCLRLRRACAIGSWSGRESHMVLCSVCVPRQG